MKKAAAVCFGPAFDAQDPGKLEKKRRREAGVNNGGDNFTSGSTDSY